ncbi:MAG TPA: hypothetical protein VMH50_17030 [Thermoleophilia bacterium]|nr:hypothetical protein [Thermoleophilia bacterium]
MPDTMQPDDVADEMPEAGGAPCGDIFGAAGGTAVTGAEDDDEMPAPGSGPCGDPFAGTQMIHVTDADDGV